MASTEKIPVVAKNRPLLKWAKQLICQFSIFSYYSFHRKQTFFSLVANYFFPIVVSPMTYFSCCVGDKEGHDVMFH